MPSKKEYKIGVSVTKKGTSSDIFKEKYNQKLHEDFLNSKEDKKHNMNSHSKWLNKKIKLNHKKEKIDAINKWKICMIDYGMNIGTEINGIRPSVIFKNSNYKYGEDVIVIPMTSYNSESSTKSVDEFDVEINDSPENGLTNNSIIKLRQIRNVSKKRLKVHKKTGNIQIKGEVEKEYRDLIENKIKIMLGV